MKVHVILRGPATEAITARLSRERTWWKVREVHAAPAQRWWEGEKRLLVIDMTRNYVDRLEDQIVITRGLSFTRYFIRIVES